MTASVTPQVGDSAPPFRLTDQHNRVFDLAAQRGETVLVFWSPACSICQELLPALTAWERRPASGRPHLVLVSIGTPAANRALGLQAPVLLDANYQVAQAYGATGTPMAIRIDAEGRIASPLVIGSAAVLALGELDAAPGLGGRR